MQFERRRRTSRRTYGIETGQRERHALASFKAKWIKCARIYLKYPLFILFVIQNVYVVVCFGAFWWKWNASNKWKSFKILCEMSKIFIRKLSADQKSAKRNKTKKTRKERGKEQARHMVYT